MSIATLEEHESQRLAAVLAVIDQQIEVLSRQRVKGSEELISYRKYMWEDAAYFDRAERVQAENVAMTQEHAVGDVRIRLKRLGLLSNSPYFGRIDFREDGESQALEVYVGLHCLWDEDRNLLIYDWRAPICSVFYDWEVGPAEYEAPDGDITGEVLRKRQYKIENGVLQYALDCDLAIKDEMLRDTLAHNTSEKMRHIVNTIQKEQNRIIRSDDQKIVIVQGAAGSGKSSIAMHRAAYLLYRHREHIGANNLLIFAPSEVFADYISNVLPELGEENIREATFDDYARSILGRQLDFESKSAQMEFVLSKQDDPGHELRMASIAFKSSEAFLRILREYARRLEHLNIRFKDITINDNLVLKGSVVEQLYREYCTDMPLMLGIERLKELVLSRSTYSSSIAERKIEREVEKLVIARDPVRLYANLFKDPKLIAKLAEDLDPLLRLPAADADAEGGAIPPSTPSIPSTLSRSISALTCQSLRGRINYEDVAPILLLKRLMDGAPKYANVRHLIIDEGQDYTPVHFDILRNLFADANITILGDLNQRIHPYAGIESYDTLRTVFGRDTGNVIKLTKSYRSSWEISEFAKRILPDMEDVENVRRGGRKPRIFQANSQEEALTFVSAEMDSLKAEGMKSIAVICKTMTEAFHVYNGLRAAHDVRLIENSSISFHHGLVVLPVYLAKGLEFDAVIIPDASDAIYHAENERKLLYTACTRALHSLTICCVGKASRLMDVGRGNRF